MQPSNYTLAKGTVLTHDGTTYTISEKLGSGGFGITYKAILQEQVEVKKQFQSLRPTVNIPVAIKELFISGSCVRGEASQVSLQEMSVRDFDDFKQRFLGEAKTLAKFNKEPNILHVIDHFEANNTAYMVMEYIEGQTLTDMVKLTGTLDVRTAVRYISQVIKGLSAVHKKNILHRDIKPSNIIITSDDQPVLIDFGASKGYAANHEKSIRAIYTPGYAPFELYSTREEKGPHTDIYSLGATLFYMLTGSPPEESTNRRKEDPPLEIPGCTDPLKTIINKAMAFEGADRYQSCEEFLDALTGKEKPAVLTTPEETPAIELKHPEGPEEPRTQPLHLRYELPKTIPDTPSVPDKHTAAPPPPERKKLPPWLEILSYFIMLKSGFIIFITISSEESGFWISVSVIYFLISFLPIYRTENFKLAHFIALGFVLLTSMSFFVPFLFETISDGSVDAFKDVARANDQLFLIISFINVFYWMVIAYRWLTSFQKEPSRVASFTKPGE